MNKTFDSSILSQDAVIAIDLHGTLLDQQWTISLMNQQILCNLLQRLKEHAEIYICTGNNLNFVDATIPQEIRRLFTGSILESGCVLFKDNKKIILTDQQLKVKRDLLEKFFRQKKYSFVQYFAERETTISIFTVDRNGEDPPISFLPRIWKDFSSCDWNDDFYLTYSDVAFDFIPTSFNKWKTLQQVAQNKIIFSIMDGYNDKEVALNSDYSFLPHNCSRQLVNYLRANNRLVWEWEKFHFRKNQAYLVNNSFTEGVIDCLYFIHSYFDRARK